MRLIYGLDIGTTSIGWAVIRTEESKQSGRLEGLGVRIFPEARDPDGTPLNQTRRSKRMMRRQLRRRRDRRRSLNELLTTYGLLPPFGGDEWVAKMGSDPYALRTKGLIAAKLRQQGCVLDHFVPGPNGLAAMAGRVRSGDPDNLEAQGAQRYWPLLFGKDFRRDRDADGINAALNYGYAIVRAATARAIVASGLIPSLGVFHKNRSNPFCLADDLFEPYRPFVDWRVKLLTQERDTPLSLDDRAIRAALLSIFNETVRVGERRLPLLHAVEASAASLNRALTGGDRTLALPEGLPLGPDLFPDDGV